MTVVRIVVVIDDDKSDEYVRGLYASFETVDGEPAPGYEYVKDRAEEIAHDLDFPARIVTDVRVEVSERGAMEAP